MIDKIILTTIILELIRCLIFVLNLESYKPIESDYEI